MPPVTVSNGADGASEESIDLPLFDISQETPELGKAIVTSAAKWGFLWIAGSPKSGNGGDSEGYDLDEETVDHVFGISRSFFKDAPVSEKEECGIKNNRGFVGMHVENLDPTKHQRGDFKQAFNLAEPDATTGQWQQPIPTTFKKNDAALRDFHVRCRRIATRILRLIALGLSIEDTDWLVRSHKNSPQSSRFLYYPSLPSDSDYDPDADIRAGAHSDYGSITLLFTRPDQPGLEILTPDGKTWASVPVFPENYHSTTFPPIVVNIGDLLSYWTNGLLRSTVHRVVLTTPVNNDDKSDTDRFSIAIFVQPADDTVLTPIPSPLVEERAASFKGKVVGHGGGVADSKALSALTAGQHLSARLRATSESLGVQLPDHLIKFAIKFLAAMVVDSGSQSSAGKDGSSHGVPEALCDTTPLLGNTKAAEKPVWKDEFKILTRYSSSLVIANLLQFSLNLTSIVVVGGRGKIELGAVSVASMTANITGFVVFQGLATSLDTLCAQAWGSGNKMLVGLHVQRMVLLLWCIGVPIAVLWYNSPHLLNRLLPDAQTAALAGLYLRVLICGIPGFAAFEAGKRLLTAQGIFLPITGILFIGASVNVLASWLFVWVFDWGFIGAPIAVAGTQTLLPLCLIAYVMLSRGRECWSRISSAVLQNWNSMLRLALPGLLMVEAEYLAFEILVLAAAYLSPAHLAAQTILATLNGTLWQIPFSISIAASTRMAQCIGGGHTNTAKTSALVAFVGTFIVATLNATLFFSLRNYLPHIFTNDLEVIALVAHTLPLVAVMQIFDGLAAYCNGALRGIGRQAIGGWVNLGCYYTVAMPLSLWTAFHLHWDLNGLSTGVTVALIMVTGIEGVALTNLNWQKSVDDAEQRNSVI
ncbi:hypothetical protein V494_06499 [Pseudogymnoascus sp. VKM F-4513 (FW-928)]|nr:hypothetical protein V494_06499 [Pseudogymnoascus sp. VKM F-4513 (FW-928)]